MTVMLWLSGEITIKDRRGNDVMSFKKDAKVNVMLLSCLINEVEKEQKSFNSRSYDLGYSDAKVRFSKEI